MSVQQLRAFCTVANAGGVQQAAQLLNLSHSAVSVQIKQLEDRLQRDLFLKGRRPLQLAPFGHRYLAIAERVVREYDLALQPPTVDQTEGLVRIGFVSSTLQTLLPRVLTTLSAAFPHLRVEILSGLSGDLADMVKSGHLDFAFVSLPWMLDLDRRVVEVAKEPLRVIAPKSLAHAGAAFDLLRDHTYIGFSAKTWLGHQIAAMLSENSIVVDQRLELDSIEAIEALVQDGHGVSILPQRLFTRGFGSGVAALDFPVRAPYRSLGLVVGSDQGWISVRRALINVTGGPAEQDGIVEPSAG